MMPWGKLTKSLTLTLTLTLGLSDVMPWEPLPNLVSTVQMGLGMVSIVAFLVCVSRVEIVIVEAINLETLKSNLEIEP